MFIEKKCFNCGYHGVIDEMISICPECGEVLFSINVIEDEAY